MLQARAFCLCLFFAFCSVLAAQNDFPPFQCTATTGTPPVLRAEGLTELVGDIILNCTGGMDNGPAIPVNFQIFLNTAITSRSLLGDHTEALLLVDDPPPSEQAVQPAGSAGQNSAANVFQGTRQSANSIVWLGVPVLPPGSVGTRVFRITNVRANANAIVPSNLPRQIWSYTSVTGTEPIPIQNPELMVGKVRSGLKFSVVEALSRADCQSWNPNITNTSTAERSFLMRFTEGFATAFKMRTTSTTGTAANQNMPGARPVNTETGFYDTSYPNSMTGGNLGLAGLADSATRFVLRFTGIPNGVKIFVTSQANIVEAETGVVTGLAGLVTPTAAGARTEVPIMNGAGTATYTTFVSDPLKKERVDLSGYVSYTATGRLGDIGVGTGYVFGSLGTLGTQMTPNFFPRFADTVNYAGAGHGAFTIENCPNQSPMFLTTQQQPALNFPGDPKRRYLNLSLWTPTRPVTNIREEAFVTPIQKDEAPFATVDWLTVTLNQTRTPATATVTTRARDLPPGTYTGSVRISSANAGNGPLNFPVTLTVPQPGPLLAPFGVKHVASYAAGELSPGQLMYVEGENFGPGVLATLQLNPDGGVATMIGETRVLFDGIPGPMFYAALNKASAFAPFSLAGKTSTQVQVEYRGVKSPAMTMRVVPALPGLITADSSGRGQGAILNQDNSVNSGSNPAAPGDTVAFFGSGGGDTDPPGRDGLFAGVGAPLGKLRGEVNATIGGRTVEVVYAGPAPQAVEGVLQVNLKIPDDAPDGDLEVIVTIGGRASQSGVTVAVRR